MNKKGVSLPIKILMGLVLLLTFLAGANFISIGLIKSDLIGKIIPASQGMFVTYIVVGLSVLATAVMLAIKTFKR